MSAAENELLSLVKLDLQLITPPRSDIDTFITHLIYAAQAEIRREGITLNLEDISDVHLVVMYASWLYRKRAGNENGMPRMLRYALNNRLFAEKAGDASVV